MFTGPPPDVALRVGMLDHTLVFRRASGLDAGVGDERPVLCDARLLEKNCVLVERARREVVVHGGDGDAVGGEVEGGGCRAHRLLRFSIGETRILSSRLPLSAEHWASRVVSAGPVTMFGSCRGQSARGNWQHPERDSASP